MKKKSTSSQIKAFVWLNIAVQTTLPLSVAFTPAIAAAASEKRLLTTTLQPALQTRVYILSAGETSTSVAAKYNMTPEALLQLNQRRTFAHGFDGLRQGDELDVPVSPLPEVQWHSPSLSPAESLHETQAVKIAQYASQAGGFLANKPNGDAAASLARGVVTGAADGQLQQMLGRFGTARVQLDADKNFSLKNSQLDLLVPVLEKKESLVFAQGSLHRTDSRSQTNLGLGYRHFTDDRMLGGNTFLDYDLSREHARMGTGVEYWRDFLKLSANHYLRLTNWKDSPDLSDYEERPANGWDVRAQGWMPSLPQLGGKLTYEKYYGKEVALFGRDNRQNNPHAITAQVNYTPYPLLTFTTEHQQGKAGKNNTVLGLGLTFQPGVSWKQHLNPQAVGAMRSLAGSRHDLVERNNNMVLEYRKKDVIRLQTAKLVTGYSGEQKSLGVSVTSRYGLDHIDWSAPELLAAGGKIVQQDSRYSVVLPTYQSLPDNVNTYRVSGIAVDREGNRSDRSETQVTVQAQDINQQTSTFTPVSSVLPANGKSVQELILTLRDGNNQTVDTETNDISLSSSSLMSAKVSALTRKSVGVYTVTVTAGTDNETVTLTPSVHGVTLPAARVTIGHELPDAGLSMFAASPETIAADNITTSTLKLVVKDEEGNPLSGLKDRLTLMVKNSSGNTPAVNAITTSALIESDIQGTYTATLKGITAGKYIVEPKYDGSTIGDLSATLTLTAGAPDQTRSGVIADSTSYMSGDDMKVTVTLKDINQNVLTGETGRLTADAVTVPNALQKSSSWTDNGDGTYTATYTAKTVSIDNKATLTLSGWSAAVESEAYAIALPTEPPEAINTQVNTFSFPVSSEAGEFPTTGFVGATFTIVPKNNASASDYTWTSSAGWASVTEGVVKFTAKGTGDKVTITGNPTSGTGKSIVYSFSLQSWFTNDHGEILNWAEANEFCAAQPGYSPPAVRYLVLHNNYTPTRVRGTGALWNEWGNLVNYSGADFFTAILYWSSEQGNAGEHYGVNLWTGAIIPAGDFNAGYAVCRDAF